MIPEISARLAEVLQRMTTAPVKHPAVVDMLDAGIEGSTPFLAMEYVAADTLDVVLRRLAPASLETAVPLLRQVAEALEAGWAAGLGHGGLHPRDIFVLQPASEPTPGHTVVRVSGFGVTEALEELRIPTPVRWPYTAPEREQPGGWGIRADVYSLAVVAHELLTGRRPANSLELDLDSSVHQALSRALTIDPAERFATPMAFVDALTNESSEDALAEASLLPFVAEADEPDQQVAPEPAPELEAEPAPDSEPELEPEPEPEPAVARGPIWIPGPADSSEPERAGGTTSTPPPVFGSFQPVETTTASRLPRILGIAAIVLIVGTGIGYWMRGTAPALAPDVPMTSPAVTKAPEEPIGTEVVVSPTAKPSPTPSPTPVRTPARTPTLEPAPRRPQVTPRPTSRVAGPAATRGSLTVQTRPAGATVSIDGKSLGTTPLRIPELTPGSHTVRVSLKGYRTVTTTVVVRAGQRTPVRLSLEIQQVGPANQEVGAGKR